jgi:hypothetical protein
VPGLDSVRHTGQVPVQVTSYPSIGSDPSYLSISRERTPDPVVQRGPAGPGIKLTLIALAAVLAIGVLVKLLA